MTTPILAQLCVMHVGTEERLFAVDKSGRLLVAKWHKLDDKIVAWEVVEAEVREVPR